MGKAKRKEAARRRAAVQAVAPAKVAQKKVWSLNAALDALLHPHTPDEQPWRLLPLVLLLAFAARAAVALAGDFVLHPDEIMQYLEPAHRLVFGNGVTYWEYFHGARSWLVPGLVAGVLLLFDLVGLGQPAWYVDGVKLVFCAISLLIPVGMYFFARRHFGETAARIALVAGAFWYELAGFAHKPLTELVATALLLALLVFCTGARSSLGKGRVIVMVAALAVFAAAIRLQYAPLALLLLGVAFLRTERKAVLALAAGVLFAAVGIFDALTWGGGLFHSYVTNIHFNLIIGELRVGESPGYEYLWWLTLASTGLGALALVAALLNPRRYGFLLALIVLVLLAHSLQAHKEYRFVFAAIPLWLLIGSDLVARIAASLGKPRGLPSVAAAAFAAVSVAGILNVLPHQSDLYRSHSNETGIVRFLRDHDPVFEAYRYLAQAPGVAGVMQIDRHYHGLPGYYYLHRKIPFYDVLTGTQLIGTDLEAVSASVSHLVSADPNLFVPGYRVDREFEGVRVWRREGEGPAIRRWKDYAPVMTSDLIERTMRQVDPDGRIPPAGFNIRFAD